ncbi:carbamoyltransferase HypF [Brevibacillus massiliensis]|uniref:carbamoyltransferase HypF n=1 Tax=Brevibacillus massiliensis TaxID=1118054 RepID=UPI001FE07402|nr:carbamoyltransferase HypF [Brevibacillus massiliensis]
MLNFFVYPPPTVRGLTHSVTGCWSNRESVHERIRLRVQGIVQGVGFRPFVYRLASTNGLGGYVCNQLGEVIIEIEGESLHIQQFVHDLRTSLAAPARITNVNQEKMAPLGERFFRITESENFGKSKAVFPADLAICNMCLNEIADPDSHFFQYPFTSCTYCGPRFSIIQTLPYDRKNTTMSEFPLCERCSAQYHDPHNRRFHAQTIACPGCGPQMIFTANASTPASTDWLKTADNAISNGQILAVKGIGGFHLMCDATQESAIARLRAKKRRLRKPFAIMAKDMETIESYFDVNEREREVLKSRHGLILLLRPNTAGEQLLPVEQLAPGYQRLGVMLPYSPLHHLLFSVDRKFMVATSGNRNGQPIALTNLDARTQLKDIADAFLLHNRDIQIRVEDSVGQMVDGSLQMLRRSRGFVPEPIPYPIPSGLYSVPVVMGAGAEWKNTFCLLDSERAILSQHIGEFDSEEQLVVWRESVVHLCRLMKMTPTILGYDPHPNYLVSEEATKRKSFVHKIPVYHHHAHMASCMAENQLVNPVIGCILDGTGYGTDNRMWGFEILIGDFVHFERKVHVEPFMLPGGEAAIKKPWMTAVSLLTQAMTDEPDKLQELCQTLFSPYMDCFPAVWAQLDGRLPSPLVSSAGRLFDGVSAMLGLCFENSYEGEAAMLLGEHAERFAHLAGDFSREEAYYPFVLENGQWNIAGVLRGIVSDLAQKAAAEQVAWKFHQTVAEMVISGVVESHEKTGIRDVVLSGGVWGNRLLSSLTASKLRRLGFQVYSHQKVPPGDGGISLGQAVIALWRWVNHVSVGACAGH